MQETNDLAASRCFYGRGFLRMRFNSDPCHGGRRSFYEILEYFSQSLLTTNCHVVIIKSEDLFVTSVLCQFGINSVREQSARVSCNRAQAIEVPARTCSGVHCKLFILSNFENLQTSLKTGKLLNVDQLIHVMSVASGAKAREPPPERGGDLHADDGLFQSGSFGEFLQVLSFQDGGEQIGQPVGNAAEAGHPE
jgi:hypothetical protein